MDFKKNDKKVIPGVFGKIQPQAREVENGVIGAVLCEKSAYDHVADILTAECFYTEMNQRIFSCCQSLAKRNMPIDILTVIEELKSREQLEAIGGVLAIMNLEKNADPRYFVNIESHCKIIKEKFIKRELARVGAEIQGYAYDDSIDAFDLLDQSENSILQIGAANTGKDYTTIQAGANEVLARVEKLKERDSHITGVPSGFAHIDRVTHGWQSTDLIIVAARPSVGKTAFALNLARNAAKLAKEYSTGNVGFFSLEMSTGQLVQRIMSAESEIPLDHIISGQLYEGALKRLYKTVEHEIAGMRMFIDDTAALKYAELRAKARRMVQKENVGVIIVDYLQLMSGDDKDGNREREISKISRELKKLAKDLHVPVIALSQLSRKIEERTDQEPKLSDLRESGAIEQDADLVIFLWKPGKAAIEMDARLSDVRYVKIAKNRNGSLADIELYAHDYIQKWTDRPPEQSNQFPGPGNWRPVKETVDDQPF